MNDVRPRSETLEQLRQVILVRQIDLNEPHIYDIKLDEYRTEFHDSRFSFLNLPEPDQLNYLNFDPNYTDWGTNIELLPNFTLLISLSNKVVIQKRIVYDMLQMFGDVGGLYDFVVLGFVTIFGFLSEQMMTASLVSKIFRFVKTENTYPQQSMSFQKNPARLG